MKKRNHSIFVILLLLLSFTWASPAHVSEKPPYKIGVNLELTGPWAEVAKTLRMAMVMEAEQINACRRNRWPAP